MRYKLILLYDPFTYPQNFENYMNDMYRMDCIKENALFEQFRTKYRRVDINIFTFDQIKKDLSEIIYPCYLPYLNLITLFILNSGYASYYKDNLMAYSDASRSFTDLCALGVYYGVLKSHDDIIPFFLQLMELFSHDIIQAGYCQEVNKFVFFPTIDPREPDKGFLNFGGWMADNEKRDLMPESNWAFARDYNIDLVINDAEPELKNDDDDFYDEDEDDY